MASKLCIAAVFATMNRASTAEACVRALAVQTRPPDLVVVADNVSSDGTAERLEILPDLPFELVVIRMKENRGNAGGVEEAMELAFARGMDAVWILDDDSWPREGALAALLEAPWDGQIVRHALQVDPATRKFTWPVWVPAASGWKLAFEESELAPGSLIDSRGSWTGALISKQIRDAVGPVKGSLFIRGEDEEYPWRISLGNFGFEAARGAVLDHPGSSDLVHWQLLGKNFFFERGLADWKLYYKIRNMVWLKRQQTGRWNAATMALTYALATAWIDSPRRLRLVGEAAADGWHGRLGKWRHHP